MKKKTIISILISAVFIYIALKGVSFNELAESLKRCNYLYLIPAFALTLFMFVLRALRWYYLVKPIKEVSFKNLFSATMIGFMANNIFPARAGEFVRANVLGADENVKKSSVFATIVIERLFDGMTLLFILVLTFILADLTTTLSEGVAQNLKRAAYGALGFYIIVTVFIVMLVKQFERSKKLVMTCLRPFPEKLSAYIDNLLDSFKDGLKIEKDFKNIAIITAYSFLHWIFCAFPIYIILKGFGYDLPLEASFVVLIMKAFAVMVPAAPGYIGTLNVAVMYALAFYGIPEKPEGVSISMVVWMIDFLTPVVIGFMLIWFKNISLKSIEETESVK
jgi:uncharacterized protein (TIRG00374 family)